MITTHPPVIAGSTDVSIVIRIVDADGHTPETAVDFNTTGIDLKYARMREAVQNITEVTLAALTTAHADGGIEPIGFGNYRLDIPDAAFVAGVPYVLVFGTITGMIVLPVLIPIVAGAYGYPSVHTAAIAGSGVLTGTGDPDTPVLPA